MTDVNLYLYYMNSYRKNGSTTSGVEGSTDSNALSLLFAVWTILVFAVVVPFVSAAQLNVLFSSR